MKKKRTAIRFTAESHQEPSAKKELTPYPHCIIPPHFYERALYLKNKKSRTLLSISTWDGRDLLEISPK